MQAQPGSGFSLFRTTIPGGAVDSFDYRSTRFFPDSPRPASPSNLTPEMLHLTFGRDEDGDIFKPNVTTNASVVSSAAFSLVREETYSAETTSAKVPDAPQNGDRFRANEARVPLSNGHQKRTRINKKKPEQGNNSYGRSGTLKCAQCRKRRSKCIFLSEWLSCLFCKSRDIREPCLKLGGPKTSPSRPLAQPIEGTVDGNEVLLLQYSYTLKATISASLIKRMATAFGMTITPRPLRHAIIAYACFQLPPEQFADQVEDHSILAFRTLRLKLDQPHLLMDGDVFAALMLAWTAVCRGSHRVAELHARGCLLMLAAISSRDQDSSNTRLLRIFSPFILDDMSTIISMGGDSAQPTEAPRRSSFSERLGYYQELCHTGTPSEAWQEPILEATYNYLRGAVGGVVHSLKHIATAEEGGSDTSAGLTTLVEYITTKISDVEFERTMATFSHALSQKENRRSRSELQLMSYQSLIFEILQLVLAILEAPNLREGLSSSSTRRLGLGLYRMARTHGRPLECLSYYGDLFYCSVALIGMVLSAEDPQQGAWILAELSSSPMSKTLARLQDWKISRTQVALIDFFNVLYEEWWSLGTKWH